jgi:hypothetical protein
MIDLPLAILLWCLVIILIPVALGILIQLLMFAIRGK